MRKDIKTKIILGISLIIIAFLSLLFTLAIPKHTWNEIQIPEQAFRCEIYGQDAFQPKVLFDPLIAIKGIVKIDPKIIPYEKYRQPYLGETAIYKNNILWIDHKIRKVIRYDTPGRECVEITQSSGTSSLSVYGNYITFLKERLGKNKLQIGIKDIHVFDLASTTEVLPPFNHKYRDDINIEDLTICNNKLAWTECRFDQPEKRIVVYDLGSGSSLQLESPGQGYSNPDIFKDILVYIKWELHGNNKEEQKICTYNFKTCKETVIAEDIESAKCVKINKDWIVWLEYSGPNPRLYAYRIKTGEKKKILFPDRLKLFEIILSKESNSVLIRGGRLGEKKDKKMYTYMYYLDKDKWVRLDTERPIEYGLSIYQNTICWSTGKEICFWKGRL